MRVFHVYFFAGTDTLFDVTVVVDEADSNGWVDVEGSYCCLCESKEVVRTVLSDTVTCVAHVIFAKRVNTKQNLYVHFVIVCACIFKPRVQPIARPPVHR